MEKEIYGKVLNNTRIVVDSLEENVENGIYFLTEGGLENPLPPHVDRTYTSPYNAKLLQRKFPTDSDKIIGLPVNKKLLIQDNIKQLDFYVTLMDAKQKPGVVMYLFEGNSFGHILYAGKCCYTDNFFSGPLRCFLKSKVLDYLYIHDACKSCHAHSVSVASAIEEVCRIVRLNPNYNIFIMEPCFREDILISLKEKLMVKISVTEAIMKHLEELGEGSEFTLSYKGLKVMITDNPAEEWRIPKNVPVHKIILIPCSVYSTNARTKKSKLKEKGYHVLTYRNHCTRTELQSLVRDLDAKHTVLIRPPGQGSNIFDKEMDADYWSHLSNIETCFAFFDEFQKNTVI